MTYRPIPYEDIAESNVRDVFRRCDAFLRDVYAILDLPANAESGAGAGNFAACVTLVSVVAGLARYIHPRKGNNRQQFIRFVADRVLQGSDAKQREAEADLMYEDFRGLLVHELASDWREPIRLLSSGLAEPAVAKWSQIPKGEQTAESIERQTNTGKVWPILQLETRDAGRRYELSVPGLYGRLKDVIFDLVVDATLLAQAEADFPVAK